MVAPVILFQAYLILGRITETEGILILGICLIALTIGIRWILNKITASSDSETDKNEA
jgi:hypothetical protein